MSWSCVMGESFYLLSAFLPPNISYWTQSYCQGGFACVVFAMRSWPLLLPSFSLSLKICFPQYFGMTIKKIDAFENLNLNF